MGTLTVVLVAAVVLVIAVLAAVARIRRGEAMRRLDELEDRRREKDNVEPNR